MMTKYWRGDNGSPQVVDLLTKDDIKPITKSIFERVETLIDKKIDERIASQIQEGHSMISGVTHVKFATFVIAALKQLYQYKGIREIELNQITKYAEVVKSVYERDNTGQELVPLLWRKQREEFENPPFSDRFDIIYDFYDSSGNSKFRFKDERDIERIICILGYPELYAETNPVHKALFSKEALEVLDIDVEGSKDKKKYTIIPMYTHNGSDGNDRDQRDYYMIYDESKDKVYYVLFDIYFEYGEVKKFDLPTIYAVENDHGKIVPWKWSSSTSDMVYPISVVYDKNLVQEFKELLSKRYETK